MCVQPASRNTHGFVNGSPPPIPRLDLEKKRKIKLPPRGGWWWWVPDAPLSLCEPCCLTVHFFPSSFLQTSPPLLPPQYLPLSFVPSTNTAPLLERTIPRPGTSSRSIVFIPFLSSLPPLSPGGGMPPLGEEEEAFARINRAAPFDATSHHRTVPILSTAARARVYLTEGEKGKKQRSRARSLVPSVPSLVERYLDGQVPKSIVTHVGWKSVGRIVRLNGGWSTAMRLGYTLRPPLHKRVHAPLYTRAV